MNPYTFGLLILVGLAVLLVGPIRNATFGIIYGVVGYMAVFFDWVIYDLFGIAVPAGWASVRPRLRAAYDTAARLLRWFFIFVGVTVLGLIVSFIYQWGLGIAIFAGLLAVIASIFFHPTNSLKTFLGLQPARTIGFILLSLILVLVIQSNAPSLFSSNYGVVIYGIVLVSWMIFIIGALRQTSSNTPHYLLTLVAILVVGWSAFSIAYPQQVRSMAANKATSDKEWGLDSMEKERFAFSTKGKIKQNAYLWNIQFDDNGKVIGRKQLMHEGKPRMLSAGVQFMAKTPTVEVVNAQGGYVEILLPVSQDSDEYPFPDTDQSKRIFVDVGKVSFDDVSKKKDESIKSGGISGNPENTQKISDLDTSSSVNVSADGKECTIVVPANIAQGVKAEDTNGNSCKLSAGQSFEITAVGKVSFGTNHPWVDPEGYIGYKDVNVDSPFKNRVGGLEFAIGSLKDNRYFAGEHYKGVAKESGIPVFRIVESRQGYIDGNLGYFTVTLKIY